MSWVPNALIRAWLVLLDTEYELSVWVRGTDVAGENGSSHVTDWSTYSLGGREPVGLLKPFTPALAQVR